MGKTAVMTGAAGMIGAGAVKKMAAAGINVAMITHNPGPAEKICKECEGFPGKVVAVTNEGGDHVALKKTKDMFGSVDIVILNHGGPDHMTDIMDVDPEELNKKFAHQVTMSFQTLKTAIPFMEQSGGGQIILMSSIGAADGDNSFPFVGSVANGAVISMAKYLANALKDKGITVNCILKGHMQPDFHHDGEEITDFTGLVGPEEFGDAVMSILNGNFTGETIPLGK